MEERLTRSSCYNRTTQQQNVMTRFQASLWAEKIKLGWFRKPNLFAVLEDKDGKELGKTETIQSEESPDWVKICFIEADPAQIVPLTVKVYHEKPYDDHILLGEASFEATEVNRATGHNMTKETERGGSITISLIESKPGMSGKVRLHLRGLDIKNVEPGLLGLGRSDPFFEIAKSVTQPDVGFSDWNTVYRSESIEDHLNPYWDPFEIGLEELCNGDVTKKKSLRISVFDAKKASKRLIGSFDTSLDELHERVGMKGNADRDMAFEISLGSTETYGLICVLACEITKTEE